MNLVTMYLSSGIETIPYDELISILRGFSKTKVKSSNGGLIILSNNKVIKCAGDYFIDPAKEIDKKKANLVNKCFFTQKELNVTGVANYDCANCMARCIEMKKQGTLSRKY